MSASSGEHSLHDLSLDLSLTGLRFLTPMSLCFQPRYPDLYTYAFAVYSCAHFLMFYGYYLLLQWQAASPTPLSKDDPKAGLR